MLKEGNQIEVCLECGNGHQIIKRDSLKIEQLPSPCLNTLISKDFVEKTVKIGDKVAYAKTDFFQNSKELLCPIINCELKNIGCKTEFSGQALNIEKSSNFEIFVDFKILKEVVQSIVSCIVCHTNAQTISQDNFKVNYSPTPEL